MGIMFKLPRSWSIINPHTLSQVWGLFYFDSKVPYVDLYRVDATASFVADRKILPLALQWEDGAVYEIGRVLDVRPSASLKAGGCGIRYTCRIHGQRRYLFLDESRWFIERSEL